ncbi:hypothetical protein D7316_00234 [Gordonia insulae]|uniref:Uncharacterized protein n=2 Tax=Gordonia insulae TaxID=2420509 RepID=A0A3G8JGD7_9ACTN|nr:hypothetical protein [Gordonia insulae]AZG43665.1 hypothetical protein D7316_00234 [Gordonia insulae]
MSGPRDLNGRAVTPGRWERLRNRLPGGARGHDPLDVAEADLVVVAESDDEAAASSSVLDASDWRPDDEVVLRHVLRLPGDRVADAVATAALDGYGRVDQARPDERASDTVTLGLARVQLLDAMHLAQERSRMASLGSRHGGVVLRWQVLQRPVAG